MTISRKTLLWQFLAVTAFAFAAIWAGYRADWFDDCDPPENHLCEMTEVRSGYRWCYRPPVTEQGEQSEAVQYSGYPDWAKPDGDSLFGLPPDDISDTKFTAIVTGEPSVDTFAVCMVTNLPCVVVFGDIQKGHKVNQLMVERIIALNPTAIFNTGDLVQDGREAPQWDTFNLINAPLLATGEFYPALGNHDHACEQFFDNFDLPNNEQWYSVDRNQTRYIVLNTLGDTEVGSEQYQWLENTLANRPDSIRFVATIFHYPPYTTGSHGQDYKKLRHSFCELFEEYGVDIAFSGHDHNYERSYCNGTYYIVTGGGGAMLYDRTREDRRSIVWLQTHHFCRVSVTNDRMIVTVYDIDMTAIDMFEISG